MTWTTRPPRFDDDHARTVQAEVVWDAQDGGRWMVNFNGGTFYASLPAGLAGATQPGIGDTVSLRWIGRTLRIEQVVTRRPSTPDPTA